MKNWAEDLLNSFVKNHKVNPIETENDINRQKLQSKIEGNTEAVFFLEVVQHVINEIKDKQLRKANVDALKVGLSELDVKRLYELKAMLKSKEISEDEFVQCSAELITENDIKNAAKKVDTGYKYDTAVLTRIGEQLTDLGYLSKGQNFLNALNGGKRTKWRRAKSHLIYLIEQIRDDGKCNYAEISKNFAIKLAANNRKNGFQIIDQIIKEATTQ